MSALITMFGLASIHASIVAVTVLVARLVVPKSAAAGRALLGAMGVACILAVTVASALPLPGIGTILDAPLSIADRPPAAASILDEPNAVMPAAEQALESAETLTDLAVHLPLAWLARIGHEFQEATKVADASPRGWLWLLVTMCALGTCVGLGRLLASLRRVEQLRRTSLPVIDATIANTLAQLCARAGFRRAIEIRQTHQLESAAAFGWRRPVIVLPNDWPSWSGEELSAVLAHEVAHIVRGDYSQRMAALSAVAVHYWHPLVRFVAWRLAMDQEFAADRLARRIAPSASAYGKGIARLALRYHDSLEERRAWPSVSVMPRSKDFLARRLEMLRAKNESTEPRSARWASYGLCAALVMMAFVAVFIRGATADDHSPASPARPIETARLSDDRRVDGTRATTPAVDPELFSRAAFDPAMLRANKGGGFLIRVADLLRHPEIQPHVDAINAGLVEMLHQIIDEAADKVDVREIEWIGGDLRLTVTPTDDNGEHGRIMLGSGGMIIRTTQGRDWQANMLKEMPGSSLKTLEGKSYVQLPSLPAIGPVAMKMRSPNDRTIIYAVGTRKDEADAETEAKFLRRFLDDAPQECPWADAWRAVDGGLVTFTIDNHLTGWNQIVGKEKEYPEFALPLFDKSKFIAFGCDWTDKSNRMGMRMRVTCDDRQSVQEIHLAEMILLSSWPAAFLQAGDGTARYHKRILQFFSSVHVQPSAAESGDNYVDLTANVAWDKQEFVDVLRDTWGWLIDLPPESESTE